MLREYIKSDRGLIWEVCCFYVPLTFRRRFMSASMLEMVILCMMTSEMRRSRLCHFPRATRAEYIPTGLRWYNLNPKHGHAKHGLLLFRISVLVYEPGSIRCSRSRIRPSCRWSVREVLTGLIHPPRDLSWYGPHLSPQSSHLADRNNHKISKHYIWRIQNVQIRVLKNKKRLFNVLNIFFIFNKCSIGCLRLLKQK